jgi:hypothetical protein
MTAAGGGSSSSSGSGSGSGSGSEAGPDPGVVVAPAWLPAPRAPLALADGEVHVWRVPLAPPPEQLAAFARTLRPDERERAARFLFERDRTAYTAARGALRTLTGAYLGRGPEELELGYRDKGKPYLASPPGEPLRFNVSHSGALALIAAPARCIPRPTGSVRRGRKPSRRWTSSRLCWQFWRSSRSPA